MSDLIRRSDAIDAIEPYLDYIEIIPFCEATPYVREAVYGIRSKIKFIPTIEPKRERCEYCKDGYFIGQRFMFGNDGKWHKICFCPNCGTKLEREQNERGLD